MEVAPAEEEKARRHAALAAYRILDTPAEEDFDDIVKIASEVCGMPVSLISLLDVDRQWLKARVGFDREETTMAESICAHAVTQRGLFEIPDTTRDARTAGNPLVTGDPGVRFYAGVPLETPEGVALGALCVLDIKPNRLTAAQALTLRALARQVMTTLALRRALSERRDSDRRNAAILDSAIDYAIISIGLDGHVTSWNRGAERILGWTEAEMIGRDARVFFTEEDAAAGVPEQEMAAALLHGRGADERWRPRKDGSAFWAHGEMMPLTDEDGRAEGFIKILRDRTEQRLAAERQRAEAEFMRGVLTSSADCIAVLDLEARLTFISEGGMKLMQVGELQAVEGRLWPDFWRGDGAAAAAAAAASARAGGIGRFQGQAGAMTGAPRWWDAQVTPILDADGRAEKLLAVSRDITEQKVAEDRLAVSEQRWRGLFTAMLDGFFLGELMRDERGQAFDYRFLEINPAFARQSGLPPDSVGRTIRSLVPDIDPGLIDAYARVVDTGEPILFEIDVPGLSRSFEVRASREEGQRFSCLFRDISPRKRAETRRAAMTELGDRLRDVGHKAEIAWIAAEILGRALGLAEAGYGEVDADRETILVEREWAASGLGRIRDLRRFCDYGFAIEALKAGEPVVTDAALDAPALLVLPVMERGRLVSLLYAGRSAPHVWTAEEIGFARDIADRARAAIARVEAEEKQRVVNLELGHRMKNMLAMVQSIATQTMRAAADMTTAKDVLAGRLIALGKSHDILLGGSLGAAPLRTLLEGALEAHRDKPDRFVLQGPDITIGAKAAMSLALMMHELATNAAKYGASSTAQGQVSLSWELRDEPGGRRCALRWSESGGPAVTPPTRAGFGSRLIGRGLAGSFGGEVALTYPVTGVVCAIDAPLDGLQAEDAPVSSR